MPISELIEKEGLEERISEFASIIPSRDPNKHKRINPIAQIIKQNKNKKLSFLEVLVNACHCTLNKKHGYILDNASRMIKPSQLFEYLNILTTGGVRCVCLETVEYDLLTYHFSDHGFSLDTICKLFERNFTEWNYRDSKITYLGEPVENFWKK